MLVQVLSPEDFYGLLLSILVSFFCGFIIGIERTRVSAQYGARDHIFFSMIATTIIILYEKFLPEAGIYIMIIAFGSMVVFLLIGSAYRLFRTEEPGYTTTLSMLLAMIVGILSYYNYSLAIIISIIFLIILATKKQFNKIKNLQKIEWTGTIEFIAICVLLFILIPDTVFIANIKLRDIIIVFIIILAIKYFSYFLLKSSAKNNLYYISFLGGFAHSEATTVELAEAGASSASIWLVVQTMLIRMIIVLLLVTPELSYYALLPIIFTAAIGLLGSFLILRKKNTQLELDKIKNPLSIRGALIFAGTYFLAIFASIILGVINLDVLAYYIVTFLIGLLSGGASSLFVATAYFNSQITIGNALFMLALGLSAATINKIFYSVRSLNSSKNKKTYTVHLIIYLLITIFLLISSTILTIIVFNLPYF